MSSNVCHKSRNKTYYIVTEEQPTKPTIALEKYRKSITKESYR